MSRWSLGLVALLALAACTSHASPPVLTVSPAETATLALRLELPWGPYRRVQFVDGSSHVTVSIDGPDLDAPYTKTVTLSAGAATLVTLDKVPTGTHRIVTIQALDNNNQPIEGAVVGAAGELKAGANTLAVSAATTALADVATRLLAADRADETTLLGKVSWASATTALTGYLRDLKVPHPGLLDAGAIADAVTTAGVFPAASAGLVRQGGRVEIRATNFPPGASYVVAVGDVASRPVLLSRNGPTVVENVVPGTWTLTLTPTTDGLPTRTQTVLVAAGGSVAVPVDFAGAQSASALSAPLGAGASALLTVSGSPAIVTIGGTTYADQGGLQSVGALRFFGPTGAETDGPLLTGGVVGQAASVHDGKLYWFGGRDDTSPVGTGFVYDPATATPAPTAPLPSGLTLRGASAGTLGDSIFVTGGVTDEDLTPSGATLAYAPLTDTWAPSPLPTLNPSRLDMASAVVGATWYLFGGLSPENALAGGSIVPVEAPQSAVTAFTASPTPQYKARADMPTARSGASAVVVDGKIWVIGGAGVTGAPTAAVEVYDPATDTWSLRPPLKRARAHAACALVDGKIRVLGGLDGADPLSALPIDSVEVITP